LSWVQATTWSPFPVFGGRLVVLFAGLAVLILGIVAATFFQTSPALQTLLLAACLPPIGSLAYRGVARARRGATVEWRLPQRATSPTRPAEPRRVFASAFAAQVWYEWRLHGQSILLLLSLLLVGGAGLAWFQVKYEAVIGAELFPFLGLQTRETRITF